MTPRSPISQSRRHKKSMIKLRRFPFCNYIRIRIITETPYAAANISKNEEKIDCNVPWKIGASGSLLIATIVYKHRKITV